MSDSYPQNYPLIPDEAFLYRPELQDMLTPSGKQRLIFEGNVSLAPHQQQKLRQFDKYLSENNINLDKYWYSGRRLKLLQANAFNFQKTIFDMNRYLDWRRNDLPIKLTSQVQNLLNQGIIYVSGRDYKYRPILVFDVKKALSHTLSSDDATYFLSYFFQYIIDNMMIQGQVENWVIIVDIGGMGISDSVDVSSKIIQMIKKIGTALSARFHSRMGKCYIVRAPTTFSLIWMIAKNFLYQDTVKKISFTGKSTAKQIFDQCHPSQIQEKFGGTLLNITKYWPIRNYSNVYSISSKPSKLITNSKYYQQYSNKLLALRKVSKKLIQMNKPVTKSTNQNTSSSPKTILSTPRNSKNIQQPLFKLPSQQITFTQTSILKSPSSLEYFPKKLSQTKISFLAQTKNEYPSQGTINLESGLSSSKSLINLQGNINPIIHFSVSVAKPRSFKV